RIRKKSAPAEVRRVAHEQLEGALKQVLTVHPAHQSEAIHEARKHIKKTRALLRLVRPFASGAFYKRETRKLRKVAQSTSAIRDAHVKLQTLDRLNPKNRRTSAATVRIRRELARRLRDVL